MMNKYRIEIKLLSDLCSSNGSTQGRHVDCDICKDRNGFPFIPGKRLKGILLQAYLDYVDISGIEDRSEYYFGEEDGYETSMYVSDALLDACTRGKTSQDFITERTQTKIDEETGIAMDGSLRTLSVVKQGNSFSFTLKTLLNESMLKSILKLVQHIGLERNRGLGHVRLTLENENEDELKFFSLDGVDDEKEITYKILVQNENNLLLPECNKDVSGMMIPGSSIYGFFAYHYIHSYQIEENPMGDEDFVSIFHRNGVCFSYGTISDKDMKECFILPSCVQKGKNTNIYRFSLQIVQQQARNGREERIKYKSLKQKFGSLDLDKKELSIRDIESNFDYHHQRDKENMGLGQVKESNFFQYESISKGQYFLFRLTGKVKYVKKLLFQLREIHVGRSRTAEYGCLKIVKTSYSKEGKSDTQSPYYLGIVESPVILKQNESLADQSVENRDYALLYGYLKEKACLPIEPYIVGKKAKGYNISTQLVSGFNMLWKKRKVMEYALSSGSYFLVKRKEGDVSKLPERIQIGQRKGEGFGVIHFIRISQEALNSATEGIKLTMRQEETHEEEKDYTDSPIYKALLFKGKAIEAYERNWDSFKRFNPTFIGRLLQMLKDNQDKKYVGFKDCVESIKDAGKKNQARKLLDIFDAEQEIAEKDTYYFYYFYTLLNQIKYKQREGNKNEA